MERSFIRLLLYLASVSKLNLTEVIFILFFKFYILYINVINSSIKKILAEKNH